MNDYREELSTFEQRFRTFWQQNKEKDSYSVSYEGRNKTYGGMPAKNPLLSNGVSPQSVSDYAQKDTRVMLNPETFGTCYEERQVFEPTYEAECKQRCGTGWRSISDGLCNRCHFSIFPNRICGFNQYYVSEVYIPVYQSRTYPGRAMGSFNPVGGYLSGQDKRAALSYDAARGIAYNSVKGKYKEAMNEYFGETPDDEDIISQKYFEHADYAGRDRAVADGDMSDTQVLHTLVYMTNFNRQHSRGSRPAPAFRWVGYANPLFPGPAKRC